MRIFVALLIAAVGIITYLSRTETNPVTGERQRVAIGVEQEMALGLRAAPEMAQQMGGVISPERSPEARLVAEVGHRLVQQSDAKKSPYVENFNFYLLGDPNTVNAFALPGGQIFITRALFDRLENEAQLAGVLGHEIGHVINRHGAEHMATGQLGQALVGAVAIGTSDEGGRGAMAAMAAQMVNQMMQLRYSRDDELESDNYGLAYMVQAGYDPAAMRRVMEILKEASGGGGRGPDFMATHPHPEDRIRKIEDYLAQHYPNGTPDNLVTGLPLPGAAREAGQRLR